MRRARIGLVAGLALVAACADSDGGGPAPGGPPTSAGEPWFVESAAARGLEFEHRSGHDQRCLFPEIMGGGAALFDMDVDGDPDAYLVQSGSLTVPPAERPPNRLFENRAGDWVDVTEASGADDRGYGMGAAVGDADGDGDPDLYVTNLGANVLLANQGERRFAPAQESRTQDPSWSTSAGFLDVDRDGDLDLYVVNYIVWRLEDELSCMAVPHGADYCSPLSYDAPAADSLYVNRGDGVFEDVSDSAGLGEVFGNGLGFACGDFDSDGWLDVFVANDGVVNQLWMNRRDGTFRDEAAERGCAVDSNGRTKAGMGVQAVDLDDDGDEDILVVNLHGESDSYYRNEGAYFSDRTPLIGLAVDSRRFTRFGLGVVELDNDGWPDLYVANGRVTKAPEVVDGRWFDEPNLVFRGGPGPRFEAVAPRGGTRPELVATSRASAFGDLDGDGRMDVLVVNRDGPAYLLENRVADGHWIALRVEEASGAVALGARVTARLGQRHLMRRVQSAYGYQTANDARIHLGLGDVDALDDVVVEWIDGERESFGRLQGDRVVVLRRGTQR